MKQLQNVEESAEKLLAALESAISVGTPLTTDIVLSMSELKRALLESEELVEIDLESLCKRIDS